MEKRNKDDRGRRKLNYFGHQNDGRGTLVIKHLNLPAFWYRFEQPVKFNKPEADAKAKVFGKLRMRKEQNLERFLVAPERKNVWCGGIRSQCEGVLTAKTYQNPDDDRGVYTVIPEIEGSRITVDAIYKMWLALESSMMRQEFLIIVEDPALAHVTKLRTERWRLMNRFLRWGSYVSIIFATFLRRYPYLYFLPFTLAMYGHAVLQVMKRKDPASRYIECCVNKQLEVDPNSSAMCDAQISLKYLRSAQYRMFKLDDYTSRDSGNRVTFWTAVICNIVAMVRNIYNSDQVPHMIQKGFETSLKPGARLEPLNVFEQLKNRFITFGTHTSPGRADLIHWFIQNALFYYFFLRHIPAMIQTALEYVEREHRMEISIRYLQFRHLQGEDRYEFPARNLYRTMQRDFPKNRVLKEIHDHYNQPEEGYYESDEFMKTRKPMKMNLWEAIKRWKISYYRNW